MEKYGMEMRKEYYDDVQLLYERKYLKGEINGKGKEFYINGE